MKLDDAWENFQINFLMFILLIMIFGAIGIVLFDLKIKEAINELLENDL